MRRILMLGAALAAVACSKSREAKPIDSLAAALPPGHVPIDQPPGASALSVLGQALVDSGNTAFREKKFDLALDFYRKASESDPAHAAPWFGTYMVGQAIKNTALADSALAMVRARAPEMKARSGGAPALPPGTPAPFSPHSDVKTPGTTS